MNRNILVIIGIIFLAAAMLIWRPFDDSVSTEEQQGYREIKPDFTAKGLIVRVYGEQGELAHKIAAEQMTHYSPIGLTELMAPTYIVQLDNNGPMWQVEAEQGSFYADKTLVLERNIEMTSLSAEEFVERIETSYLTINTREELVITEQPVLIIGRDFTAKGEGMRADLRAQTLEMTKHVETIYTGRSATSN
ncbi:LPS export ABC transporter periplasmic protein LptC [Pseudidiomarina tainanensis]|uniref:LPS export ABC transporter periplasmic protein LptC n=1 Tax=Pseudidiomarina tainanensis TaxID=502365 RepID=A0ACD2HIP8_9GAMM|nr:LPS export ABC transporter periplasmic protein LptC [Pseudidiomarina tainanensis]RZQ56122.1 LPS export ABC transporter periplasmic protein LptC [Pseudidiomarina tainanensis]